MGQRKLAFGAGNADVHQAAFFFDIVFFDAVIMRQDAFFATDKENVGIFQTFGSVQGGEFDGIDFFFAFAFQKRHQGNGLGKLDDIFAVLLAFAFQPAGQVGNVAPFDFACFAFFVGQQVVFVVDFFQQVMNKLACFAGFGFGAVVFNHIHEGLQVLAVSIIQQGKRFFGLRGFIQAAFVFVRVGVEFAQCDVADAAFGRGDGAQEGGIVIGIGKQAQIGQNVFDFGFVEKTLPAGELVRNARAAQGFLKNPRLMVAAV